MKNQISKPIRIAYHIVDGSLFIGIFRFQLTFFFLG